MKKKLDVLDDVFFTIWLFGWVVTPVFLIAMIFVSSDVMDAYGVYIFTVFWVGVGGLVTSHLALKVTSYIRDTSDDYDSKRTISSVAHEYDVKANQAGLDHSYVDERQKEKEKAEKEKAEKAEKEKQRMREKMLKTKWGRVPISGNKLKNALSILQSRSESINDMWWTILMESGHPILEEVLKRYKQSFGLTGFTDVGGVAHFVGLAKNDSLRAHGNEIRKLLLEALTYNNTRTKINAATSLGRVGSRENIPELEHALKLAWLHHQENPYSPFKKEQDILISEIEYAIKALS